MKERRTASSIVLRRIEGVEKRTEKKKRFQSAADERIILSVWTKSAQCFNSLIHPSFLPTHSLYLCFEKKKANFCAFTAVFTSLYFFPLFAPASALFSMCETSQKKQGRRRKVGEGEEEEEQKQERRQTDRQASTSPQ